MPKHIRIGVALPQSEWLRLDTLAAQIGGSRSDAIRMALDIIDRTADPIQADPPPEPAARPTQPDPQPETPDREELEADLANAKRLIRALWIMLAAALALPLIALRLWL